MKYVVRSFAVSLFFLLWQSIMPENLAAQFSGGNGTAGTPYLINSYANLDAMSDSVNTSSAGYDTAHYRVTNDIDVSTSAGEHAATVFTPSETV